MRMTVFESDLRYRSGSTPDSGTDSDVSVIIPPVLAVVAFASEARGAKTDSMVSLPTSLIIVSVVFRIEDSIVHVQLLYGSGRQP